jgi:uncharacterized protein
MILLFAVTMGLSLWASMRVRSEYRRFSEVGARSGVSGAQAAARILQRADIHDVQIVAIKGELNDHYDPMNRKLVLSEKNYYGHSLAALGVAAHEAGHAIQHKEAYAPLNLRMGAVKVTGIASQIVLWLPLIGMFTGMVTGPTFFLILAASWGVLMLFQLVTLPVEFDASRRAKALLASTGMISSQDEHDGVRRVLDAAAWTYVAAFITTFLYFLWYLMPLIMGRDD